MRIGDLAARTGATRRALRYYEEHGLLPDTRTSNGYREYDELAVNRVENIRRMLSVGFTAEEILHFVPCLDAMTDLDPICPASLEAIARKLSTVQSTLDELTKTRDHLAALVEGSYGESSAGSLREAG
ncbi:MerR family transcriptional regulator [Nocardia sp. NPDC050175]|uniref:MerR family transcriptional regulator n=1 Tax=Nocardia sp. NPDC050175 TaxID=3364317 RepID=UPI0037B7ECF1